MTIERRLIEDEAPDGVGHALLDAGRRAEPTPGSKQKLLVMLLAGAAAKSATGGAAAGSLGKAGVSTGVTFSLGGKIAALTVAGGVAVGGAYMLRGQATTQAPADKQVELRQPASHSGLDHDRHAVQPSAEPEHRQSEGVSSPPQKVEVPDRRTPESPPGPTGATGAFEKSGHVAARRAQDASQFDGVTSPAREQSSGATGEASPGQHGGGLVDTRLAEELRYLDAARNELKAGDMPGAREQLEAYFRRFPDGYLKPEASRIRERVQQAGKP